uniref:Uncharacterized protein n=1 Tax=Rhizophora mucronata TaxID=61149 RepID=A0A2P2R1A4_RHIMU
MTQLQQAPVEVGGLRRPPEATTPCLSTDEGLLGDIVRPGMNNRR